MNQIIACSTCRYYNPEREDRCTFNSVPDDSPLKNPDNWRYKNYAKNNREVCGAYIPTT
jgi:hypothetical protein